MVSVNAEQNIRVKIYLGLQHAVPQVGHAHVVATLLAIKKLKYATKAIAFVSKMKVGHKLNKSGNKDI